MGPTGQRESRGTGGWIGQRVFVTLSGVRVTLSIS